MDAVLSDAKVRRLRLALGVAIGLGLLTGMLAGLAAGSDAEGAQRFAAVLGAIAVVVLFAAGVSWRLLTVPDRTAKRAVVATGAVLVVSSLLTAGFWLGLLYGVLGLAVLFLTLVGEREPST